MAVRGINYDEGNEKDLGYESVTIHLRNDDKHIWNTGDFVRDWYYSTKFVLLGGLNGEIGGHSSSVDHFIMDGAPYDSAYLRFDDDGNGYLTNQYDYEDDNIEFFIPEGTTPTWDELREMCGDPKMKVGDVVDFTYEDDIDTGTITELNVEVEEDDYRVRIKTHHTELLVPYDNIHRPTR